MKEEDESKKAELEAKLKAANDEFEDFDDEIV